LTPDLARVDVVGPGGVLASQQLSAQAPVVRITQPKPPTPPTPHGAVAASHGAVAASHGAVAASHGAVEFIRPSPAGTVHVAWTVTPSNNILSSVLYSSDGGKTWIDRDFEDKITSFDVLLEPHVHKHQVKIVVTDGTRSSSQVVKFSTQ